MYTTPTVPTRLNLKPKQTPKVDYGSVLCLVRVCFSKTCIFSGSAQGLLWVYLESGGPLYALKCDRLLACLLAYSKYTCKDIQSFFSSDLRIWFWSWGLFSYVLSVSAWGLLGVSSESAIADLKQTLGRHRKQAWGLVWVNYLIGWVWSIL